MKKIKQALITISIMFLPLSSCSSTSSNSTTSEENLKTVEAFLIKRNINDSVYDLLNFSLSVEKCNTNEKIYSKSFSKKITDFPTKTIQVENEYEFLTKENYSNFLSSGRYFKSKSDDDLLVKTEDLYAGVKKINFYYFSELQNEKIVLTKRMPSGAILPTTYNEYVYNFANLLAQFFTASRITKVFDFGTVGEETGTLPNGTVSNEKEEENYAVFGKAFWFTIDGQNYYIGRNKVSKNQWQQWMEENS